jgi:hypothetical protein
MSNILFLARAYIGPGGDGAGFFGPTAGLLAAYGDG